MNKLVIKSVYVVYTLVILNVVLTHNIGFSNLYYFFAGILIAVYFLFFIDKVRFQNKSILYLILFYCYFTIMYVLSVTLGADFIIASERYLSLIWPSLFFLLLPIVFQKDEIDKFIKFQIYAAFFIAILGIIQIVFSRDLFGFIPRVQSDELYENILLDYRVTSILYSPQVYGLFLGLSSVLILEHKNKFTNIIFTILLIVILLGAVISGNKMVIAILIVYIIYKFLVRDFAKTIKYSLTVVFILILTYYNIDVNNAAFSSLNRSFDFLLNPDQVLNTEQAGRFTIYSNVISTTNPVIGNLVGSTNSSASNYINTESYFLSIYSEGGLILLSIFLMFIYNSIRYLANFGKSNLPLVICIAFSMIFVHAFESPIFIGMWGIWILNLKRNYNESSD